MDFAAEAVLDVMTPPRAAPGRPPPGEDAAPSFEDHLDAAAAPERPAARAPEEQRTDSIESEGETAAPEQTTPAAPPQPPASPLVLQVIAPPDAPPVEAAPACEAAPPIEAPPPQPVSAPAPLAAADDAALPSGASTDEPVETQPAVDAPKSAPKSEAPHQPQPQAIGAPAPPITSAAEPSASSAPRPRTQSTPADVETAIAASEQQAAMIAPRATDARTMRDAVKAQQPSAKANANDPLKADVDLAPTPTPRTVAKSAPVAAATPKDAAPLPSAGAAEAPSATPAPSALAALSVQTSAAQTRSPVLDVGAARAAPAAAQVAREIVRRFDGDATKFELRLDPPELGRVEVRLEVTRDHRVTAVIAADSPQALTELARHARELQQTLQSAGLELTDNGLSFDLRQQREDAAEADRSNGETRNSSSGDDEQQPAAPARALSYERWRGVRVDVMV
jgi:flagellar hook-length control protein FliK